MKGNLLYACVHFINERDKIISIEISYIKNVVAVGGGGCQQTGGGVI